MRQILLAILLLLTPAVAFADDAPIALDPVFSHDLEYSPSSGLHTVLQCVTFTNDSAKTATAIQFRFEIIDTFNTADPSSFNRDGAGFSSCG